MNCIAAAVWRRRSIETLPEQKRSEATSWTQQHSLTLALIVLQYFYSCTLCLQFLASIPLSHLSSNRCVDCEARLGGAGAKSTGQPGAAAVVEYSNTDRGPVCGVGFGCKKNEKGTANGTAAVGGIARENNNSETVIFVASERPTCKQK